MGALPNGRAAQADRDFVAALAAEKGLNVVPLTATSPAAPAPAQSPSAKAPPALRDGDIHLGRAHGGGEIGIDLAKLIDGRLLIQGNSGSGKSRLLRRIFEQAFGRVQQLILDRDGEFVTLKDKFDVAVFTAADVRRVGARAFALHMREHRYSAVVDLSDAPAEDCATLVADLATGLIEAPPEHWRPLLVLIDEVQTIAPHSDPGDVAPAVRKRVIFSLADLMGRGRKRGIAGILATQRLAETAKPVTAKATNVIVGRTTFDVDVERAGPLLGLTGGACRVLRNLADGEFLGLGPALAGPARVRFRSGPVQSEHKGAAPDLAPPPSLSGADAAALLQRLPATAEENASPRSAAGRPTVVHTGKAATWPDAAVAIVQAGVAARKSKAMIRADLKAAGYERGDKALTNFLEREGLKSDPLPAGGRPWTPEDYRILRERYDQKVSPRKIAEELGRTVDTVRAKASMFGLLQKNFTTPEEIETLRAAAKAGGSLKDAALQIGRSYSSAKSIARNHFITGFKAGTRPPGSPSRGGLLPAPFSEREAAIIAQGAAAGKSRGAIRRDLLAAGFEWGDRRIESHLRRQGLSISPAPAALRATPATRQAPVDGWSDAERKILIDAAANGEALLDAAERIDRPLSEVKAQAQAMGLSFGAPR